MDLELIRDVQMFSTGVLVAFAVLHFILYLQQKQVRTNLFFGWAILFAAAATFLDFQTDFVDGPAEVMVLRFQRITLLSYIFLLYVVVERLFGRVTTRTNVVMGSAILIVLGLASLVEPERIILVFFVILIVIAASLSRMTFVAIRQGLPNARIIAFGLGILMLSFGYDAVLDAFGWTDRVVITNGYPFGLMALLVATSSALARDTADVHRRLAREEQALRESDFARQMTADALARKQAEIEDARRLQQSFLPDGPPDVPFLETAFSQKMAQEVGGDYYDYHVLDVDHVLLAVGDATGHGMRGGLMVAAAKSLFQTADREAPPSQILSQASEVIKQMRLQSMFMGLTVARMKPGRLTVASAGMPPVLIRRVRDGRVDQLIQKTMPLGAFRDFPYEETAVEMEAGDLVVILSDGLTECFNADRVLLGVERVVDAMKSFDGTSADELLDTLHSVAFDWCGDKPYDDDMTVVVVRYLG